MYKTVEEVVLVLVMWLMTASFILMGVKWDFEEVKKGKRIGMPSRETRLVTPKF